jgi:hypothetical protein
LALRRKSGGEHPRMGTHNCFVKLGDKLYLEIIAINPAAPRPDRPRWFALDEADSSAAPRLAAWIVRTNDIHAAVAASPAALGNVEPMSRGSLNWLITIPPDGSLPLEGVAPTVIQWPAGVHPADTLPDSGCSLVRLEGFHPRAGEVRAVLQSIGFEGEFSVSEAERPGLIAHIRTPAGLRQLR